MHSRRRYDHEPSLRQALERESGLSMRASGMIRMMLGIGLAMAVTACGGETFPAPGYKPYPPLSAGNKPPVATGSLSGRVYTVTSSVLDPTTSLPQGYQLLAGEEGRVTVRIPGTPAQTRVAPIKDGRYELTDLPIGVTLEVLASCPGYASRRQQVEIVLPAGRRLNFDYDPDGAGSYLMPLKDPPAVSG